MGKLKEEGTIIEIGAKGPRRRVQSKLAWGKPRVEEAKALVIEDGGSQAKTPEKDMKIYQSKLPWCKPPAEEAKVIVVEEEKEESEESEGKKKGRKRKSQARTPQKSPAKNKEARRSSARNKSNKKCQQSKNKQPGEDTPTTSPISGDAAHGGSSSKKSPNNKRSEAATDVGGQSMNMCRPLTNLWLEAKIAAEENLRLSAGKQTHPFFSSIKTAKRLPEIQETNKIDMRCWPGLDGDYNVSCPPVHVFDTSEDEVASFNWKNWVFTETPLFDMNGFCAKENALSSIDGSIKPLILDTLCNQGMHLDQLSNKVDVQPLPTDSSFVDGQPLPRLDMQVDLSRSTSMSPRQHCCVDNLENMHQDRFLAERLTSYYQRISCWPECSLWTNKYQPENALEVCGNSEVVRFLGEWLKSWNGRVLQSSSKKSVVEDCVMEDSEGSSYEIESDMDDEVTLKNVLLITGPIGSGKSAAIYACAKEQGFEVIEVNTSDLRNGAHMKQAFGQAMDSHSLNKWSVEDPNGCRKKLLFDLLSNPTDIREDEEQINGSLGVASRSCEQDANPEIFAWNAPERCNAGQAANKTLILFEDVDTVFDGDRGFIASILHLAETAKRPIILTSNCRNPVLPQVLDRHVVDFALPSSNELLSHLYMICDSEKAHVSSNMLEHLVTACMGDIRKTLLMLQFWCQGKGLHTECTTKISYSPLSFDIDATHLVIPRMVPWELQCKLSEKVLEEINKAVAKAEDNLQQIQAMPEELSMMEMIDIPKTRLKGRKRSLSKRNSSFLDSTELLDNANDLQDFFDASSSPETKARQTIKRRPGIILSSQSDDGSADERPIENFERHDTIHQPLKIFETASVSHICDTFRSQDVSCVPESSFISGTETYREDDFPAISSHNISFSLADNLVETNNSCRTIIDLNKIPEDVESVNGNEEEEGFQNEEDSTSCRYQLMDECSRADFSLRLLPEKIDECSAEVDLVQETWRKLRCNRDELKSYLPDNNTSFIVKHVSGLSDLISEADMMFKSCYPLNNDIVEPSMIPCVEPEICSFYEEQMEMGSIYAQHGLCFHTRKLAEVGLNLGHSRTMDLAQEMLASSMNIMALGKLLCKRNAISENSHLEGSLNILKQRCSIPTGREMEFELYDAIISTVPARLSMALRGSAFHDYVSFLSKISRLDSSRLSHGIVKRKRGRAARHYLSSGSLSFSDENIQLLAQSGYFKNEINEANHII